MDKQLYSYNWGCQYLENKNIDSSVLIRYNEPHRYYHTWNHIHQMLSFLNTDDKSLMLATLFHDIVYNPKEKDNEEKSAELFKSVWKGDEQTLNEVCQMIIDTKTHVPTNEKSKILLEADLSIFKQSPEIIAEYDKQIFKEYQFVDWKTYSQARLIALEELSKIVYKTFNKTIYDGLFFCIEYTKTFQPKIGVFTGSFNPFHIGHQNVLEKAEKVFDKVIIARGINTDKKNDDFRMLPKHLEYHQQEMYHSLVTDFIKELKYPVTLIRGIRNAKDFEYELMMNQYIQDINKGVGIPTTMFLCDREFAHVSSSAIKTLPKKEQEMYLTFNKK